jgi:hypothetical protein
MTLPPDSNRRQDPPPDGPDRTFRPPQVVERRLALLERHFHNRQDVLAHKPRKGNGACPLDPCGAFRGVLLSHLTGDRGPKAKWVSFIKKTGGAARGPFRIGTYSPALDGTTLYALIDFDAGEHSRPLADALGAALAVQATLSDRGLTSHLELSKSGDGWHAWTFFTAPAAAALVRKVYLAILPRDLPLQKGGCASAWTNAGLELFPKQASIERTAARLGNQVWLPWWHGAAWPRNQFHRRTAAGVEPWQPEDFETVDPEVLLRLERELCPPEPSPHDREAKGKRGPFVLRASGGEAAGSGRVSASLLLRRAVERADSHGRHDSAVWLSCQLRDNEFTRGEAEPILQDFAERVEGKGDHPFTVKEALDTLDVFASPPRGPWKKCLLSAPVCSPPVLEHTGADNRHSGQAPPTPEKLVKLRLPPPAKACKRNPAHYLSHTTSPERQRASRFACNGFVCGVCTRRKAYTYATHVAAKLIEAAEAGRVLALAQVPAGEKANVQKALRRAKAGYCRVQASADVCRYVAAFARPGDLPPSFTPASLESAGEPLGEWMTALQPRSPEDKSKSRPVTLSRGWCLPKREKSGDWMLRGKIPCREPGPVLDVLARYGVQPLRQSEAAAHDAETLLAYEVGWELPKGWPRQRWEAFEEDMVRAADPKPEEEWETFEL